VEADAVPHRRVHAPGSAWGPDGLLLHVLSDHLDGLPRAFVRGGGRWGGVLWKGCGKGDRRGFRPVGEPFAGEGGADPQGARPSVKDGAVKQSIRGEGRGRGGLEAL
jgi:hypothetical protein